MEQRLDIVRATSEIFVCFTATAVRGIKPQTKLCQCLFFLFFNDKHCFTVVSYLRGVFYPVIAG